MIERQYHGTTDIIDSRVTRETEFPLEPGERFDAIFAAIGNSEAKCLTLLCLSESPITEQDLYKQFIEKSAGVWKSNRRIQPEYCHQTLAPIGLVAEADILRSGSIEYITGLKLTQAGKTYGQPIAAFLLKKSTELPNSLVTTFGQTSKGAGKTRSVINGVRVLEELAATEQPQRREGLAENLNLDPGIVGNQLRRLLQLGLVNYSSIDPEVKGLFRYELAENARREKIDPIPHFKNLTGSVADYLFEHGVVDTHSIAEHLKEKFPNSTVKSLSDSISAVLSGLLTQGAIKPELFYRKNKSQATITKQGETIVGNVIKPIREALSGNDDLIDQWKRIPWQNYARQAIYRYKESSGLANSQPQEEWTLKTLEIVRSNPGIRPRQIQIQLQHNSSNSLKTLLDARIIRKEKHGHGVCYWVIE